MQQLSKQNINYIVRNIRKENIHFSHLQDDLLDHVCCDVEDEMEHGISFKEAYTKVIQKIGNNGLKEVQDATIFYVNLNLLVMKKIMYYFAGISATLLICGMIFKVNHWPGANVFMFSGFILLFIGFFPLAFISFIKDTKLKLFTSRFLVHVTGFIILIEVGAALLFRHMHWPGGGALVILSWVLMLFVFFPMIIFQILKSDKSKIIPLALAIFAYLFFAITIVWGYNNIKNAKNLITYVDTGIKTETEFYKNKSQYLFKTIIEDSTNRSVTYLIKDLDRMKENVITGIENNKKSLLNNSIDVNALNRKLLRGDNLEDDHYEKILTLKNTLDSLQNKAFQLCKENKQLLKLIEARLSVEPVTVDKNWHLTWERINFMLYLDPVYKYNNLNRIERDVYLVYSEILSYLETKKNSDV